MEFEGVASVDGHERDVSAVDVRGSRLRGRSTPRTNSFRGFVARLDGEAIRDALLAISGRLSDTAGGPPVFPALPAELTKLSGKGPAWPVSERAADRDRRSLYVFVRRNLRYPFFEAFDRPDTNASCPRRSSTTIAPRRSRY